MHTSTNSTEQLEKAALKQELAEARTTLYKAAGVIAEEYRHIDKHAEVYETQIGDFVLSIAEWSVLIIPGRGADSYALVFDMNAEDAEFYEWTNEEDDYTGTPEEVITFIRNWLKEQEE